MTTAPIRSRTERIEVRATPAERALVDEAVASMGTDLTTFVLTSVTAAAQRVLADRVNFRLDALGLATWEAVNERPARSLDGLRALMARPSPFAEA